jgi:hypothetical protein
MPFRWCYCRHRSHFGSRLCLSSVQADLKTNEAAACLPRACCPRLEPYEAKVSRTVLRGRERSNPLPLPGEETQTAGTAAGGITPAFLLFHGSGRCKAIPAGARETEAAMSSSAITSQVPKGPGEPPLGSRRCLRCSGERMEPGALHTVGGLSFRPAKSTFWTLTPNVEIQVLLCLDCGNHDLRGWSSPAGRHLLQDQGRDAIPGRSGRKWAAGSPAEGDSLYDK